MAKQQVLCPADCCGAVIELEGRIRIQITLTLATRGNQLTVSRRCFSKVLILMVFPAGFEPAAYGLEIY